MIDNSILAALWRTSRMKINRLRAETIISSQELADTFYAAPKAACVAASGLIRSC